MKKILFASVLMLGAMVGYGAGFGLYEASARGNAMGGALVGKTGDASALYYNPANMTDNTNVSVVVGITFINPYCDVHVDGQHQSKMNAGWFYDPNFYITTPAFFIEGLHFGFGGYSEFGLGSEYDGDWLLAGDTVRTEIEQYSFVPAISYDITDWWSVAAGLRISYFYFYNKKHPNAGTFRNLGASGIPTFAGLSGSALTSELEGDDTSLGYFLATKIKITEDLHFGAVWRSQIRHEVRGDFKLDVNDPRAAALGARAQDSWARANIVLPQSVTLGLNYDITEDWRIGATLIWTEWSKMEEIAFQMPNYGYHQPLNWRDAWRFGIGTEYDVTDWMQARLGYVYDMDPTDDTRWGTTMLPSGDRHIIATGLGFWITDSLRFDVGYSLIIMAKNSITLNARTSGSDNKSPLERDYEFSTRNGFSHLVSCNFTYNF